jgi:hypothetical protein
MQTKREFARTLVSGTAGLVAAGGGARAAAPQGPEPKDAAYRVFPGLPVRRNDKIRSGGDYHTIAGTQGFTSAESLNYFRRFNARWLTAAARNTGVVKSPTSLGGGAELTAEGPGIWTG